MRAAFFGTPDAAVPSLRALHAIAEVILVVTRPDRPRGRSGRAVPSAVKEEATGAGLPLFQPESASEAASRLDDVDVAVVVAYGQLLPPGLLDVPRCGFVNVHFSLLPRWRGPAPVARAILAGDVQTGVSLIQVDEGFDTGPVLATAETRIEREESAGQLTDRLALLGADLLVSRLREIVADEVVGRAQGEGETHAAKLTPAEARLEPTRSAEDLYRQVRAFTPEPGAWGEIDGNRFMVLRARPALQAAAPAPGEIVRVEDRVLLGTGRGVLELLEVQAAGGRHMSAGQWMNGRRGEPALLR